MHTSTTIRVISLTVYYITLGEEYGDGGKLYFTFAGTSHMGSELV